MATSSLHPNSNTDYFSGQPSVRKRPSLAGAGHTPGSPRTPLVGRSVSGTYGSPGSFSRDQEEVLVYELSPRHISAGFAGESKPRCIVRFGYGNNDHNRVGDYRHLLNKKSSQPKCAPEDLEWSSMYELYRADLRSLDLGLVHDKFERTVRGIHVDHLQLDQKPRKVALVIPSLLPTKIIEIALNVLFNHHAQPPAVTLLPAPIMYCVSGGLRAALIVEIGWEESVVTAIGEYKVIAEQRSIRGGKKMVQTVARHIDRWRGDTESSSSSHVTSTAFPVAEEVRTRMTWCRQRIESLKGSIDDSTSIRIPLTKDGDITVPFERLSEPVDEALFAASGNTAQSPVCDDNELPLHHLIYKTLLCLPLELRAICISRMVITGPDSKIPGIKRRLLQELQHLIKTSKWDRVHNYGTARKNQKEDVTKDDASDSSTESFHSTGTARADRSPERSKTADEIKRPTSAERKALPASDRLHHDVSDPITLKAEREGKKRRDELIWGSVRGVESLGAWPGASMVAHLRVKGVHEIEREDFLKHGLRESSINGL